jgi:hypothetical protein
MALAGCGGDSSMGAPLTPEASLRVAPQAHDFGDVVRGNSVSAAVAVMNVGGTSTAALATTITGDGAASFAVAPGGCAGVSLGQGDSCTIGVSFSPDAPGKALASLSITSGNGATAGIDLAGNGLAGGALAITPAAAAFGTVAVGSSAATTVTITNSGATDSGPLALRLGGTAQADLTLAEDTCTGATLASGASCTVQAAFAPRIAGDRIASLTVKATPGGASAGSLLGTGQAQLKLKVTGTGSGTISSYPAGLSCDRGCDSAQVTFTVDSVMLIATPAAGSTLAEFAGCDELPTAAACEVRMDGAQESVFASFTSM